MIGRPSVVVPPCGSGAVVRLITFATEPSVAPYSLLNVVCVLLASSSRATSCGARFSPPATMVVM
ncbi:hypothetical protein EES42_23180 [Streptomyces sp. ADI95-17]|nr:hypothetical protein EES42_23180 [Streptomyces sp. ADI95-17]